MSRKTNIVLIGMMGSGKTTVGRLLAQLVDKRFVDTDLLIEKDAQKEIKEIFAQDGEAEFRRLETRTIALIADHQDQIIATGGGVILNPENIKFLRTNGMIVFLHASVEQLVRRLSDDTQRPLILGNLDERIIEIFAKRLPLYRQAADFEILTDGLRPEEIAKIIRDRFIDITEGRE